MPPVSEKQRRAMAAAAHGKSSIGIPKKVGMEMMNANKDGKMPMRKSSKSSMPASHGKMSEAEHKRMMQKKKSPVLGSYRY